MSMAPFPASRPHVSPILGAILAFVPALGHAAPPPNKAPAASVSAAASASDEGASSGSAPAARALYAVGVDQIEKKQWKEAHAALTAAWALKQHWQIGMMLGWAEMEIGQVRSAVEHLTKAQSDPATKEKPFPEKIDALLLEAKARLPHVRIQGAPPGAALSCDGVPIGTAPFTDLVAVDPGQHTVSAKLGTLGISEHITVPARSKDAPKEPMTVTIPWPTTPTPAAGTAGAPMMSSSAATPSLGVRSGSGTGGPSNVPVIVLGAAAGAALLAGFGVFIASEGKGAEALQAKEGYDKLIEDASRNGEPLSETTLAGRQHKVGDLLRDQDALTTGAIGLWLGAAVLGAGAVGYFVHQRAAANEKPAKVPVPRVAMQWTPVISPESGGVMVQGSF